LAGQAAWLPSNPQYSPGESRKRCLAQSRVLAFAALAGALCLGCAEKKSAEIVGDGHDHSHDGHDLAHGEHGHEHGDKEHAHEDDYKTLYEAVGKLQALRTTMSEGFAKGEKDKADVAVHEVGHVLERVEELVKESTLTDEQKAEAKKDIDELFDHFGQIDERIHADKDVAYDEFSTKIDAAIERLHERTPK
jgi:hypothetical protein